MIWQKQLWTECMILNCFNEGVYLDESGRVPPTNMAFTS